MPLPVIAGIRTTTPLAGTLERDSSITGYGVLHIAGAHVPVFIDSVSGNAYAFIANGTIALYSSAQVAWDYVGGLPTPPATLPPQFVKV